MITDKASAEFGLHWRLYGGDTGQETGGTQEFLIVEVHSQNAKTGHGRKFKMTKPMRNRKS